MKITKAYISIILLTLFISISAFATTNDKKDIYRHVEVETFTATEESEFPQDKLVDLTQEIYKNFLRTKRFKTVTLLSDKTSDNEDQDDSDAEETESTNDVDQEISIVEGKKVRVSGEIIKYKKGSRAKRYLIGFGAGKTKIVAKIKLTDVDTGEVILEAEVDGDVKMGFFGGNSDGAEFEIADEIVDKMKKKKLVGKKLK